MRKVTDDPGWTIAQLYWRDIAGLEGWLADQGRQNIQALNEVLARGATAWWDAYGGKDNIEVIEPSNTAH